MTAQVSRRRFLVATGWLAAGSTVVFTTGCSLPILPTRADNLSGAPGWIQILPDGRVQFFMGKAEMGQGILTGLTQLVSEELGVSPEQIQVRLPTSLQVAPLRMTVGSETIKDLYQPVRQAAAQLRESLRMLAAGKVGVPPDGLVPADGGFRVKTSGQLIRYGDIVRDQTRLETADSLPPPSLPSARRFIGKSVPRLDIPSKVTGAPVYSHDIRLPDMLHGAVARPPAFGAYMVSVDTSGALAVKGMVKVVAAPNENFVGVVAENEQIAREALQRVRIEWKIPRLWQQEDIDRLFDIERMKRDGERPHRLQSEGNVSPALASAHRRLDLTFQTSFAAHAQMETQAGVAHVADGKADLWVGSQDTYYHQARAADLTGLPKEKITVHPVLLGGGFGGKVGVEAVLEAVRLSKAVKRPVKVVWSREENLRHGYFRSPTSHRIQAGLSGDGRVTAWRHEFASGAVIFSPAFIFSKALRWATSFVPDAGGIRGAAPPYAVPNKEIHFWNVALPVPTGPWRGLGASVNAFAIESAMDELALLAGADPLRFRLQLLHPRHTRLSRVLTLAAEAAGWGAALPPDTGLGIACGVYKDMTYVAVVAQVRLDRSARKIRVEKLVCAHDCGLILNPDAVAAQIEGNLMWGCSMSLLEELSLKDGKMSAANFHEYPFLRAHEAPQVQVILEDDGRHPPMGAGEPAIMPTPAAIANAVYRASGKRMTRLPFRTEELFA